MIFIVIGRDTIGSPNKADEERMGGISIFLTKSRFNANGCQIIGYPPATQILFPSRVKR
jgi:hypothetical protein